MSWKNPEEWKAQIEGGGCSFCKDVHLEENPHSFKVIELKRSFIRLPKNQYWKGWLVVALKRHATELYELSSDELAEFWQEVSMAAKAVNKIFRPVKINYAIYGNLCPHLHCHIFPQQFENDPHASINQNEKEVLLSDLEYKNIIDSLQRELKSG